MKIRHVLFPSVFSNLRIHLSEAHFSLCSHDPIFRTNKNRIIKNRLCEWALTLYFLHISSHIWHPYKQFVVIWKLLEANRKLGQ